MIDEKCSRMILVDYRSSANIRRAFGSTASAPVCGGRLADLLSSFHRLRSRHLLSQPLSRREEEGECEPSNALNVEIGNLENVSV